MANEIRIKVGEIEYEGDKEFAQNELPELVASLMEATDGISSPGNVQSASTTNTKAEAHDPKASEEGNQTNDTSDGEVASFDGLPTFLHEANWSTDQDRLLLAAAFLQENEGREGVTNKEINEELRPLGEDIDRSDSASAGLKDKGYFIRVGKDGQYNKHKVTPDGLDEVKKLLEKEDE